MEYVIICLTALLAAIITLFSGFGLGTVLMPVFAIFFPLPIAIASTAVIHLANNFFKAILVGKLAKWSVVLAFGVPAALFSALGAYLLKSVSSMPPVLTYSLGDHLFTITVIGLTIGLIIVASSLFELVPKWSRLSFAAKYVPLGGALSGFFGGISGNQGILRSAFLIKAGLTKEEFIGTGVMTSIAVDVVRVLVYGWAFYPELSKDMSGILVAASLTAFLGSYIGSRLIDKITFRTIQVMVGTLLFVIGLAIALGLA